ncbi:hypothetical protein [Pseudomonas sp.]|nr:hypothetical protein [Pseudomonas sp.]
MSTANHVDFGGPEPVVLAELAVLETLGLAEAVLRERPNYTALQLKPKSV